MKKYTPELVLLASLAVFLFALFVYDVAGSLQVVEVPLGRTVTGVRVVRTDTVTASNGYRSLRVWYREW